MGPLWSRPNAVRTQKAVGPDAENAVRTQKAVGPEMIIDFAVRTQKAVGPGVRGATQKTVGPMRASR